MHHGTGPYNAVAPTPVTNRELTRLICQTLQKSQLLPNVPAFALNLMLGELSTIVLGSSYIVNERIEQETDFHYQFSDLEVALKNVL
jgi:NAD dependent epimerase/dehydratase family enzyme